MDKKFYTYHLKNEGLTKLLKIKFNCVIQLYSNNNDINTELLLKPNGYDVIGNNIPQIEIYYDSTNKIYYICSNGHDDANYINFNVNIANDGYAISDYEDNFDTTGLTKLNPLNINNAITNRKLQYSPQVNANVVTEYISKCEYKQYMKQCSLIMFSIRNANNVGVNALMFLHRLCGSSLSDTPEFSIEYIYTESGISNFSITPTKNGFTFTSTANYKYSITEISNNTDVNFI